MVEFRGIECAFVFGVALLVCACTGGKQWVAETPTPTHLEGGPAPHTVSALEEDALWRDSTRAHPRPRLNRVMSLGEIDLPTPEPPAGIEASGTSPVVVNVNNTVTHSVYYGGGYSGYSHPHRWNPSHRKDEKARHGSKTERTTPKVGGDWPKIEVPQN